MKISPSQPSRNLAFSLAVYHRQWQIVDLLVSKGLDPNGRSLDGQQAIIVAASSDAWNTVAVSSQKGANLGVRNADGRTVILIAASCQNWGIADCGLEQEAISKQS
jgi:ankyrin repeat protein